MAGQENRYSAGIPLSIPFPVEVEIPVQWGDMDALGHVNNVCYFRYFETGRVDYFRKVLILETLDGRSTGPILASATCDYIVPLVYPDRVRVGVRVSHVGRTSFTMDFRIVSLSSMTVAARGQGVMVNYDYVGKKPEPLSPSLRERIRELETPLEAGERRGESLPEESR